MTIIRPLLWGLNLVFVGNFPVKQMTFLMGKWARHNDWAIAN